MKKLLLLATLLFPLFSIAQKKGKEPKVFDLIVGTFTGPSETASKGIYVYRFYEETGRIAYLSQIETSNPSYLAVTADHKFVYSVNENNLTTSGVTAFKFDKATGLLEKINSQPSIGSPAYIAVDKAQKNVFIANYGGGSLMGFPINKDGSLGASTQTVQNTGSGPDLKRQTEPHAHAVVFSPDEKFVLLTDLGTDKINVFKYKASKLPPLSPADEPFIKTGGGSGPRHIDFSPNGKFMYNIQEMTATITAYTYKNGEAKEIETIKMMPADFKGVNGAADIHITPDGLFLYATNRGSANQIVAYAIDQLTGKLTYIDRYKTGDTPRNFVIDPTGKYLLIGTALGISVHKIDRATGKLTLNNSGVAVMAPVCLKLVPVE